MGELPGFVVCSALECGFPIVRISPSFEALTGYQRQELLGRSCSLLQGPATEPEPVEEMARALAAGEACCVVLLNYRKDGSTFLNQVALNPIEDETGRVVEYLGVQRDVTERRRASESLAANDGRYERLVERLPGIVTYFAEVGDNARLTYVSPQVKSLLGFEPGDFVDDGGLWGQLIHPDDRLAVLEGRSRAIAAGERCDLEYRMFTRDDRVVWVWEREMTAWNRGSARDVNGVIVDITERKRYEAELERLALYDALTGLPNRRLFEERLGKLLERPLALQCEVGVLMIDVDEFKRVNDTLGHDAGDDLLRKVGQRISARVRETDTVARFGGDEFVVLCDPCESEATMIALARRLLAGFATPMNIAGHVLPVTASIGIALTDLSLPAGSNVVLREADAAMYHAKRRGPGHFEVFDRATRGHAVRRLGLEAALNRALDQGELYVEYQPKVNLATGQTPFVEALVRWQDPDRGAISPREFIPLAEATGLISRIGAHVRETACRDAARWRSGELPELGVCVNLAGPELSEDDLVERVDETLKRHNLPASCFGLEWTETATLDDVAGAQRNLNQLGELGCHLSVDDFGTGYASLRHLRDFPTHEVKIDRSFVAELSSDEPRGGAFAAAIVHMAGALRLDTVGEGIETAAQITTLRHLACDYGQGFLLARPVALDHLPGALDHARRAVASLNRR